MHLNLSCMSNQVGGSCNHTSTRVRTRVVFLYIWDKIQDRYSFAGSTAQGVDLRLSGGQRGIRPPAVRVPPRLHQRPLRARPREGLEAQRLVEGAYPNSICCLRNGMLKIAIDLSINLDKNFFRSKFQLDLPVYRSQMDPINRIVNS